MEIHIFNNLRLPEFKTEINSGVQLTQPDLALTIPQIIQRTLDGDYNLPVLIEDETGNVFDLRAEPLDDILPYESDSSNFESPNRFDNSSNRNNESISKQEQKQSEGEVIPASDSEEVASE